MSQWRPGLGLLKSAEIVETLGKDYRISERLPYYCRQDYELAIVSIWRLSLSVKLKRGELDC